MEENQDQNQDRGITEELIQEILDNVCLVLNIVEPEQPEEETEEYEKEKAEYDRIIEILKLYIQAICTNILIKTNRRMFIPDLKYIVCNLVVDKYTNDIGSNDSDINSIQSMSEAGRSVNFGISNALLNKLNLIAQKQIEENETLINKYKLLYKT